MLKHKKKTILKNKVLIIKHKYFFLYQLKKSIKQNNNIRNINRAHLFTNNIISKKFVICLKTGKKKSVSPQFKLNRSVVNSFVQFNYFPGIKSFGQ
jgi:hypothetical protein